MSDRALVYEQYYDGTSSSWIKNYEGGIKENAYLFTSDFRIPYCSNPFANALPAEKRPAMSFFNNYTNSTEEPCPVKDELNEYAKWVMEEYDINRDGRLNETESKRLVEDLKAWGVSVTDVQHWIDQFDRNNDGNITIEELSKAIPQSFVANKKSSSSNSSQSCPVEQKVNEYAKWVMEEYDTDKDGQLNDREAQRLVDDIKAYDFGGEAISVRDVEKWIDEFDRNNDGKISLEELAKALDF